METIRPQKQLKAETLDPVNRPEFRQFARNVLDNAISYASGIPSATRLAGRSRLCKAAEGSSERKGVR